MQVINQPGKRPIKAWVGTVPIGTATAEDVLVNGAVRPDIEDSALQQLSNIAGLPFIDPNGIAVMPDVHAGIGATVGSVIATQKAIIPAAVGVDIGCGMNAVRLSLKASDLPDNLKDILDQIYRDVPVGFAVHQADRAQVAAVPHATPQLEELMAKMMGTSTLSGLYQKLGTQMGTLGGGNHFIELCLDESQDVWVMLHSGSRGIGNKIGNHFIERAKRRMEQFFITLPDGDLAYLPEDTDDFRDYVAAVEWAQNYALENRRVMMAAVLAALVRKIPVPFTTTSEAVNCHHNYISRESHFGRNLWVTRKGAIRAREGDLGIIPGSMGARSYIVRGKGNLQSYCSCSHGAGRVMSRTAAKKRFSLTDLVAQTQGVTIRKDEAFVDEIPAAYKDIDKVMANQADLVEVVHTLKQVLCVKGAK